MSSTTASAAEHEHIGAVLRTYRELRGLTTSELANKLLISYAYLNNIEAGRKRLTPELVAKAADILKVRQIALVRADLFPVDDERLSA